MSDMRKWMNIVEGPHIKYGPRFNSGSIVASSPRSNIKGYSPGIKLTRHSNNPSSMSSRVKSKKHIPTSSDEIEVTKSKPRRGGVKSDLKKYLRQDNKFRELDDFISHNPKSGLSKAYGLRADRKAYLLKKLPFGPIYS